MIARIKQLRRQSAGERGKSNFARSLGISPSTYSYYENSRVPPIEIMLKICEVTNCDLHWLLTGAEPQKIIAESTENIEYPSNLGINTAKNITNTVQDKEKTALGTGTLALLLNKIETLVREHPDLTDPIAAFAELLSEKKGIEKELQPGVAPYKSERSGWIPVLGRTAAGIVHFWNNQSFPDKQQAVTELDDLVKKHIGKTIIGSADSELFIDLQTRELLRTDDKAQASLIQVNAQWQDMPDIVEFVECREISDNYPDSFALKVDGDSMSPRIKDGDIVILSPSVPAAQGNITIAHVANQIGVTCKLIRFDGDDVHLIPINEKYETKVISKKDLLWALSVLCHISL